MWGSVTRETRDVAGELNPAEIVFSQNLVFLLLNTVKREECY